MPQGFPIEFSQRAASAALVVHAVFIAAMAIAIAGQIFARSTKVGRMEFASTLPALLSPFVGYLIVEWSFETDSTTIATVFSLIVVYVPLAAVTGCVACARATMRLRRDNRSVVLPRLLIPVSLLAALFTVVVPGVTMPRPVAHRLVCRSNLRQVGLALHNYSDAYSRLPPVSSSSPAVSWRILVLPFLDDSDRYKQYDQAKTWNSPRNFTVACVQPRHFRCPSNLHPHDPLGRYYSAYVMLTGQGTIGGNPSGTKFSEIRDGTSNTIAVTEACGLQIIWTEPRDFDVSTQPIGINLKGTGDQDSPGMCSSYHGFGAYAVMADGSVRSLSQSIDSDLLRNMSTIAGGERIEEEF